MKITKVKDEFGQIHEYFMISNFEELKEYADSMTSEVEGIISRVLRSGEPQDRWDHLVDHSDVGGILAAAVMKGSVTGENPLFTMNTLFSEKLVTMNSYLSNGEILLINENGGYCPFIEDYHTIISEEDYVEPVTYKINKNTKYINLENDADLEEHTKEYLGKIDFNYSYICRLRKFSHEELVSIFKEFMTEGGDTVYIYTTGMDVPQMYEYCEAIVESGLKKVVYDFVGDTNTDIIEYLKSHGIEAILKT